MLETRLKFWLALTINVLEQRIDMESVRDWSTKVIKEMNACP